MSDPEDEIEETMTSSVAVAVDPATNLARLLGDIELLLKDGGVVGSLTGRGVNASLALVAVEGLRAYLIDDKKAQAAEDFSTVAEEIFGRLAAVAIEDEKNRSGGG